MNNREKFISAVSRIAKEVSDNSFLAQSNELSVGSPGRGKKRGIFFLLSRPSIYRDSSEDTSYSTEDSPRIQEEMNNIDDKTIFPMEL